MDEFRTGRPEVNCRENVRKCSAKNPRKLDWISGIRVSGQAVRLAQPIETKQWSWLRGVDLNHRPLGYEPSTINDSIAFQRLDGAGNDIKSLKRHRSTVIRPQSDHCSVLRQLRGKFLSASEAADGLVSQANCREDSTFV